MLEPPRSSVAVLPAGVREHRADIGELPVFWYGAEVPAGAESAATPLYVHGVPTSADDWLAFLARSGGVAVDLPGFGRSGKPGYLKFSIAEYGAFIESFLDLAGLERVQLVVHDWGSVGLELAQRHPERIERLVVIDAVPFLPGYRWHRIARVWRTPGLGELAMGLTTRRVLAAATRGAAARGSLSQSWLESVMTHFDPGTQRAILRLYRAADSEVLAQAGSRLCDLDMPALVLWGARDPYVPVRFARAYADALPSASLEVFEDAGHWPWLDRTEVVDRVVSFLAER